MPVEDDGEFGSRNSEFGKGRFRSMPHTPPKLIALRHQFIYTLEKIGFFHSPFPIPHSPFPVPRSPFPVPHD